MIERNTQQSSSRGNTTKEMIVDALPLLMRSWRLTRFYFENKVGFLWLLLRKSWHNPRRDSYQVGFLIVAYDADEQIMMMTLLNDNDAVVSSK